jgi:hypothetical protein
MVSLLMNCKFVVGSLGGLFLNGRPRIADMGSKVTALAPEIWSMVMSETKSGFSPWALMTFPSEVDVMNIPERLKTFGFIKRVRGGETLLT